MQLELKAAELLIISVDVFIDMWIVFHYVENRYSLG